MISSIRIAGTPAESSRSMAFSAGLTRQVVDRDGGEASPLL